MLTAPCGYMPSEFSQSLFVCWVFQNRLLPLIVVDTWIGSSTWYYREIFGMENLHAILNLLKVMLDFPDGVWWCYPILRRSFFLTHSEVLFLGWLTKRNHEAHRGFGRILWPELCSWTSSCNLHEFWIVSALAAKIQEDENNLECGGLSIIYISCANIF